MNAEVKPAIVLQVFVALELQGDLRCRVACIRTVHLFLFCIALTAPNVQIRRGEIALVRDIDSIEVVELEPFFVRVQEANRIVSQGTPYTAEGQQQRRSRELAESRHSRSFACRRRSQASPIELDTLRGKRRVFGERKNSRADCLNGMVNILSR